MCLIRLSVDIYEFDVQVYILAKVLYLQELLYTWDLGKRWGAVEHVFFVQNLDARLAGIVIWADRPYLGHFTRGPWNRLKIIKDITYRLIKSRVCFLCWGRRSAAGSSDTDTKGLGILKSMNIHTNHLYWFNKWQFLISTPICWKHQICIRTYPMRGYLLTWYVVNPSARWYLLSWYFMNLGIALIFVNVDILLF